MYFQQEIFDLEQNSDDESILQTEQIFELQQGLTLIPEIQDEINYIRIVEWTKYEREQTIKQLQKKREQKQKQKQKAQAQKEQVRKRKRN